MKKFKLSPHANSKACQDEEMNQVNSKPAGAAAIPLNGDIHSFGTILRRLCSLQGDHEIDA